MNRPARCSIVSRGKHRRRDAQRVRLGEQFFQRAKRLHLAAVINHHAIANVLHIRKQMAAENHRLAAPRQSDDEILDLAAADGVEAGSRFVEDDEVGIVDERLRETDAALHALGEFAHRARARLAQADHFQQLLGPIVALALFR